MGTLTLPLLSTVGGSTYRLDAVFTISGAPGVMVFQTDDAPTFSRTLPAGSYYTALQSFTLSKDDGTGTFQPLNATYVSGNQYFNVYVHSTTTISFQFQTDAVIVPVGGSGTVNVAFDVTQTPGNCTPFGAGCPDGYWCPPAALTGEAVRCLPHGDVPAGSACNSSYECVESATCQDFGTGPVCAALCLPAAFDTACSSGGTCVEVDPSYGVCTPDLGSSAGDATE